MPKIKKRNAENAQSDKIIIKLDMQTANSLLKYVFCEYVSKIHLSNLLRLINYLDMESYGYNAELQLKLKLLQIICEGKVTENLKDMDILDAHVAKSNQDCYELYTTVDKTLNQLSGSECKFISDIISEKLQFLYIYRVKDKLVDMLESIDSRSMVSYFDTINQIKTEIGNLMVNLQTAGASNELIRSFDFSDDTYASLIDKIVMKAKRPESILMTGIRQLNAILSPGFQSGRLYVFLGGTGKFKSGTLLNITDQIRLFNPQIKPVEGGLRKTILFVTMENTIEETVARLFDMYSDSNDDLKLRTTEEVIQILRDNGHFIFSDSEGISITLQYYGNLEINTSNLYTIIQDLQNNGKQVIAVVLDYLKKIDSVRDCSGDDRLRLSYATKELKLLAQNFEIPVITAMQINRDGNGIIDAAMRDNKHDVAQFIGASSVGECWNIIEESDWVCLINPELQKSCNQLFLTFKRLKIRGKKDSLAVDYFNHPFVNDKNIRLKPDVMDPMSASIMSLASDLESIDEKELTNAKETRPRVSKIMHGGIGNNVLKAINIDGLAS